MAETNGEYDQDLEDRILKIVGKLRGKSVRPCYQNIHCKLNQGGRNLSMDDAKVFINNLVEAGLLLNKPRKDKESFYLNSGGENNLCNRDESFTNSEMDISQNQDIASLESFVNEQFYDTLINRIKSEVNIAVNSKIQHLKLNELTVISDDECNKGNELKLKDDNKNLNEEIKLLRAEILTKDELIKTLRNDMINVKRTTLNENGDVNNHASKKQDANNKNNSGTLGANNLTNDSSYVEQNQTEILEVNSGHSNDNFTEVKPKRTKRQITVLGTSMIKNIQAYKMKQCIKPNERIYIKSFSGATIRDLVDHSKPSQRYDPDLYILHGGGNDLSSIKNPEEIASELMNLATNLKTDTNDVIVSSIITRKDKFNEKGIEVNNLLRLKCRQLSFGFIDNSNLGFKHLNNSGIHLNYLGTNALANNFLKVINI